ncbi:hypothetical protein QZH41_017451 [Actinostola sp. cb2023]|nr:hypothetical protein QZH41_017451 [Actinostola sp. cb2023]
MAFKLTTVINEEMEVVVVEVAGARVRIKTGAVVAGRVIAKTINT